MLSIEALESFKFLTFYCTAPTKLTFGLLTSAGLTGSLDPRLELFKLAFESLISIFLKERASELFWLVYWVSTTFSVIRTSAFWVLNFKALDSKFVIICCSRTGSPYTLASLTLSKSDNWLTILIRTCFEFARWSTVSTAPYVTSCKSKNVLLSLNWLFSHWAKSNKSCIRIFIMFA